jgi:uncharacterized protein (DUF1800 family)
MTYRSCFGLAFIACALGAQLEVQASTLSAVRAATSIDQDLPRAATNDTAQTRAREAQAAHVLNRLAFGPRPGDVDRVVKLGIERWIEEQLRPESIVDQSGTRALAGCQLWTLPFDSARSRMTHGAFILISRDSARRLRYPQTYLANAQLVACRLARIEASDHQLLEVMTNFWENHFSVYGRTLANRTLVIHWDRSVLRPNALGRFRDLLGAVAHSPQMLNYLDNDVSRAAPERPALKIGQSLAGSVGPNASQMPTGLNENYARELLELHTMGVDGGYTQADVIEVARALTGWTTPTAWRKLPRVSDAAGFIRIASPMMASLSAGEASFVFDSTWHDAGEKTVLGKTLHAGRGVEDGEEVLDLLARQPSTARFIARKLAVRFVSDDPPDALIERAAQTFTRTDGDIREVVRTIVTSPEFLSPNAYAAKIKSPLELVLSTRRALAAPVDTVAEAVDLLLTLKQPPFGYPAPDGWPETGADWMNAGALIARMNFATSIARSELPSIPLENWPAWALSTAPFEKQVDGVLQALFPGRDLPKLRKALLAARPEIAKPDSPETRERAFRHVLALALGSAEFQRR